MKGKLLRRLELDLLDGIRNPLYDEVAELFYFVEKCSTADKEGDGPYWRAIMETARQILARVNR